MKHMICYASSIVRKYIKLNFTLKNIENIFILL